MMIHGQELSEAYLNEMFGAIANKIPANKWVEITKEPEQAVAAIKHFIDCKCYSEDFNLTLSSDSTMFRKDQWIRKRPLYKRFMTPKELEDENKNTD